MTIIKKKESQSHTLGAAPGHIKAQPLLLPLLLPASCVCVCVCCLWSVHHAPTRRQWQQHSRPHPPPLFFFFCLSSFLAVDFQTLAVQISLARNGDWPLEMAVEFIFDLKNLRRRNEKKSRDSCELGEQKRAMTTWAGRGWRMFLSRSSPIFFLRFLFLFWLLLTPPWVRPRFALLVLLISDLFIGVGGSRTTSER